MKYPKASAFQEKNKCPEFVVVVSIQLSSKLCVRPALCPARPSRLTLVCANQDGSAPKADPPVVQIRFVFNASPRLCARALAKPIDRKHEPSTQKDPRRSFLVTP